MNKLFLTLCAVALATSATQVFAAERADPLTEERPGTPTTIIEAHPGNAAMPMGGVDMKSMDLNSDGMLSKDEFMAKQAARYDAMKKNAQGMVDMNDMMMMHGHDAAKCQH